MKKKSRSRLMDDDSRDDGRDELTRVTTYLENLEMSGNVTAVREMSGN